MDTGTITLVIAIWGAVLSTALGVWDFYKWKSSGPKLRITATGPMISSDKSDRSKYLSVRVTNVGTAATTLTGITYRYFKTKPKTWKKAKADELGILNLLHKRTSAVPHKLEPGDEWTHIFILTASVEEKARNGYFYLEAVDSVTENALKFGKTLLKLSEPRESDDVPRTGVFFTQ
jgi:hypothetical protein